MFCDKIVFLYMTELGIQLGFLYYCFICFLKLIGHFMKSTC